LIGVTIMGNDQPLVSVVIVTWNSGRFLPRCLASLVAQNHQDFEVLLIDNGSTDGCLEGVEEGWPSLKIKVELSGENKGFSAANNLGARLARGKWLALLNSDAFPEPAWLEELLQAAKDNPEFSIFASRQLQANAPYLLDGAGDSLHVSGLAWRRFAGFPADRYGLEKEEVFSPCAAAALYLREVFLMVGGFDESFFSYHEDIDLGFRARLLGFRCLYVPGAVVHHVGSASLGAMSDFALYHWQRNFIWSFIQNMPSAFLWVALPAHLLANIFYQVNYSLRGRGGVLVKAKTDALHGFFSAMRKRKGIQKNRKINNKVLSGIMEWGFLQPYLLGFHIRHNSKLIPPNIKN
jgi:GT2 family glycosyltransferase